MERWCEKVWRSREGGHVNGKQSQDPYHLIVGALVTSISRGPVGSKC